MTTSVKRSLKFRRSWWELPRGGGLVTADIVGVAQPYAAFATSVFGVDAFPWEDHQPKSLPHLLEVKYD
jgi:hypothetical protein